MMLKTVYLVALVVNFGEFQGGRCVADSGLNEDHTYFHVTGVKDFFNYGSLELFELSVPLLSTHLYWRLLGSRSDPSCPQHTIMVFIQHGSYPLVAAKNNMTYPSNFFLKRTNNHSWALATNDSIEEFTVENPRSGSWFGAAYVVRTQKNKVVKKIGQVDCDYRLHVNTTTLYMDDLPQLVPNSPTALHYTGHISHYYRFFINDVTWQYQVVISKCSHSPCPLLVAVRGGALPRMKTDNQTDCSHVTPDNGSQCIVGVLGVEVLQWQYLVVTIGDNVPITEKVSFTLEIQTSECHRSHIEVGKPTQNRTRRSVGKQHKSPNTLRYKPGGTASGVMQPHLTSTVSSTNPAKASPGMTSSTAHHASKHHHHSNGSMNTNHHGNTRMAIPIPIPILKTVPHKCFPIKRLSRQEDMNNEFYVVYSYSPKSSDELIRVQPYQTVLVRFDVMPIKDMAGTLHFIATFAISKMNLTLENVTIDICLSRGIIPTNGTQFYCPSGGSAVHLTLNSAGAVRTEQNFPYPEPGAWYISMQSKCYKQKINSTKREPVTCSQHYHLVEFLVNNAPCVNSHCTHKGSCSQYTRGIYTLSSCNCRAGYRGYNCDDDSEARSHGIQLMNTLCLTLSNLCFLPAIILACYRRYFVEALVYFANMFFSSFYHACDMSQWSMYTLCIMPYHVLSYCDFFLSIMSFWVTLMAVARLPAWLRSISHMVGAITLAMAVEWAEHSAWSNIAAIVLGVIVVLISWIVQCGRRHKLYPAKRQCLWLLPGLALALMGLAIFGLIETDPNYPYTHSAWHACMSLAIVFLLPHTRQPLLSAKDEGSSDEIEFSERNPSTNMKPADYDPDDDDDDLLILP